MVVIYDKTTGRIISQMSDNQDMYLFYINQTDEFKEKLACVKGISNIQPLRNYKVIDGEVVERLQEEIEEINQYGKVLTDEDRVSLILMPSNEEIQKAKATIEILSLLQEVNVI